MVQLSMGRGRTAAEKPRAIVATEDGVFLWPGIALVQRKGHDLLGLDSNQIAELIKLFFGPEVIVGPTQTALRKAAAYLLRGDAEGARQAVDRAGLPPVSPNGYLLMCAIACRQGIPVPTIPVAIHQSGTAWDRGFADIFAKTFDNTAQQARVLSKAFGSNGTCGCDAYIAPQASKSCGCTQASEVAKFNPAQPRIPKGSPNGGQWTADGTAGARVVPAQEVIITPRFFFPEMARPFGPEIAPPAAPDAVTPKPAPAPIPIPDDVPLITPRNPWLDNPYPEKEGCEEEWQQAHDFCRKVGMRQPMRPDNKGFGNRYRQCVMGQVTERCGGNPVEGPHVPDA